MSDIKMSPLPYAIEMFLVFVIFIETPISSVAIWFPVQIIKAEMHTVLAISKFWCQTIVSNNLPMYVLVRLFHTVWILIFYFEWHVFLTQWHNSGCVLSVRIKKERRKKKNRMEHAIKFQILLSSHFLLKEKKIKWREKNNINEANCWRTTTEISFSGNWIFSDHEMRIYL